MSTTRKMLLLVGSPKRGKSTSESLGTYLLERVKEKGMKTDKLLINQALSSHDGMKELLGGVEGSDVLVLTFPLYIDSLPAAVIRVLETIAEHRRERNTVRRHEFLAIVNSGFPEADQSETALAICRRFAKETGFAWVGGLALGGGEAIGGQSIEEAGGRARHAKKALDLTAEAIVEGRLVPEKAMAIMARPFIPRWLYAVIGDIGWRRKAVREGCRAKLDSKPYVSTGREGSVL